MNRINTQLKRGKVPWKLTCSLIIPIIELDCILCRCCNRSS